MLPSGRAGPGCLLCSLNAPHLLLQGNPRPREPGPWKEKGSENNPAPGISAGHGQHGASTLRLFPPPPPPSAATAIFNHCPRARARVQGRRARAAGKAGAGSRAASGRAAAALSCARARGRRARPCRPAAGAHQPGSRPGLARVRRPLRVLCPSDPGTIPSCHRLLHPAPAAI